MSIAGLDWFKHQTKAFQRARSPGDSWFPLLSIFPRFLMCFFMWVCLKIGVPSCNQTWQCKIPLWTELWIGTSLINGPFSIAMSDYRKVYPLFGPLKWQGTWWSSMGFQGIRYPVMSHPFCVKGKKLTRAFSTNSLSAYNIRSYPSKNHVWPKNLSTLTLFLGVFGGSRNP